MTDPNEWMTRAVLLCGTVHPERMGRPCDECKRNTPIAPAPSELLCEDEGCPHHGTKHVCVSSALPDAERWTVCDTCKVRLAIVAAARSTGAVYADLSNADLHGANLRWAALSDADLHGANLSGADLRWAALRDADLHGANLSNADLRDADLHEANLRGADLSNANLSGANLSGAVMYIGNVRVVPYVEPTGESNSSSATPDTEGE